MLSKAEGSGQKWVATGCVVSDVSRIVAEVDDEAARCAPSEREGMESGGVEKRSRQQGNSCRPTAL